MKWLGNGFEIAETFARPDPRPSDSPCKFSGSCYGDHLTDEGVLRFESVSNHFSPPRSRAYGVCVLWGKDPLPNKGLALTIARSIIHTARFFESSRHIALKKFLLPSGSPVIKKFLLPSGSPALKNIEASPDDKDNSGDESQDEPEDELLDTSTVYGELTGYEAMLLLPGVGMPRIMTGYEAMMLKCFTPELLDAFQSKSAAYIGDNNPDVLFSDMAANAFTGTVISAILTSVLANLPPNLKEHFAKMNDCSDES